MKTILKLLNIFLLLTFFNVIKGDTFDPCPTGQVSISGLGKCLPIQDLLTSSSLNIKTENLLYLASNNEGIISKDNYKFEIFKLNDTKLQSHNKKKSKLYIPNSCLDKLKRKIDINLETNKGIVIIVYDSNNVNKNNIPDIFFIIRHNSDGTSVPFINSKNYDFSVCNDDQILFEDDIKVADLRYGENDPTPIDIDKIIYARKKGIDLFNFDSPFFSDTCFEFTSEKGTDVTMDSRAEDYYQNITFCDDLESSHYLSYNLSSDKTQISYRCSFGFYSSSEGKSGYLDKIDSKINELVSVSNIKVIECYKNFLNLKDIIRNYGGMICIVVLLIQIICFLIFCFLGFEEYETKVDDLFIAAKVTLRRLGIPVSIFGDDFLINKDKNNKKPKEKFYLWEKIKSILKIKKQEREQNNQKNNHPNPPGKTNKKKKVKTKESKESKITLKMADATKENSKEDLIGNDSGVENKENNIEVLEINQNDIVNDNKNNKKEDKKDDIISEKNKQNSIDIYNKNQDIIKNKEKFNNKENGKNKDNIEDKSTTGKNNIDEKKKEIQIYEQDDDDYNELPYAEFMEKDKRKFCVYYWSILKFSHIILNLIFRRNDFNIFTVKLGLLFMTFPINLTFNIFFYTNKSMKLNYSKAMDDLSYFWDSIDNTVYSSILSNALLIMLKLICLTNNDIRKLKKLPDVNFAQKQAESILRSIKIRVIIYYILSFIFLIIFGYYILCFCSVFENTQIELVRSTFTSWLISLLYPFIVCFITSIVRDISRKCKCFYGIKKILQLL